MIWSGKGDRNFIIQKFENNNELINWIKCICSLEKGGLIGQYNITQDHWLHVSLQVIHDDENKKRTWKTLNMCHMESLMYIDEINAFKKFKQDIKFSYSRNEFIMNRDCSDLWFLNSRKIKWNKFTDWLKSKCIEFI